MWQPTRDNSGRGVERWRGGERWRAWGEGLEGVAANQMGKDGVLTRQNGGEDNEFVQLTCRV